MAGRSQKSIGSDALSLLEGQRRLQDVAIGIIEVAYEYRDEAERCATSSAWFAGTVMIGASLEAIVLAMVYLFPIEVRERAWPTGSARNRHVPAWGLATLLELARTMEWLPSGLTGNDEPLRGDIGDAVEFVRAIRNLVHPGRHVRADAPTFLPAVGSLRDIDEGFYRRALVILDTSIQRLFRVLEESALDAATADSEAPRDTLGVSNSRNRG